MKQLKFEGHSYGMLVNSYGHSYGQCNVVSILNRFNDLLYENNAQSRGDTTSKKNEEGRIKTYDENLFLSKFIGNCLML